MGKKLYNSAKNVLEQADSFYVRMPEMLEKVNKLGIPESDPYWKAIDDLRVSVSEYENRKKK